MLRVNNHLTLQGLATKLGYADAASICNFENGKRIPSIEILYNMSELFNVSISYLLEGEDTSNMIYEHRVILDCIESLPPSEKEFLLNFLKQYIAAKH